MGRVARQQRTVRVSQCRRDEALVARSAVVGAGVVASGGLAARSQAVGLVPAVAARRPTSRLNGVWGPVPGADVSVGWTREAHVRRRGWDAALRAHGWCE